MKKSLEIEMTIREFVSLHEKMYRMDCTKVTLNGKKLKNSDKIVMDFVGEEKLSKQKVDKKPKSDKKKPDMGGMFG